MSNTVQVKGISSDTSEKEIRDFFSFCGKIQSLSVSSDSTSTPASQSAHVTFEKETAAKTALLLDNTQLGSTQVNVTAAQSLEGVPDHHLEGLHDEHDRDSLPQEDKPRSRILAEYLAQGYVVSDKTIERAIALDQQHGVSNRFMTALTNFDNKYGVSQKTAEMDQKYGVSSRAQQGWLGLASYFEQAASTPTGQKLRGFYDQGSKQVLDVHNEAKHLASLKTGKSEAKLMNPNDPEKNQMQTPEQAEMEKVQIEGKERTKCNCGGVDGKCPCEPGKCACAGCDKAS